MKLLPIISSSNTKPYDHWHWCDPRDILKCMFATLKEIIFACFDKKVKTTTFKLVNDQENTNTIILSF